MTPPTIFAIFMLCSPDLLTCEEHPDHQPVQFINNDECLDFVARAESFHNAYHEGSSILLGKCVWRIVEEK